MIGKILLSSVLSVPFVIGSVSAAPGSSTVYAEIRCNGEAVVRTTPGQLQIVYVDKNIPGCVGTPVAVVDWIGTPIQSLPPLPQPSKNMLPTPPSGPALDLESRNTVHYRLEELRDKGVQYTNPVRSVRMREDATTASETEAYLMKNDAIVTTSGEGTTRWTGAVGADIEVIDTTENIIAVNTQGKANGYISSRYLRDPNPSDLVRIGQADQEYWSDTAHVKVAHLVNVRAHPWVGAKILTSLKNGTKLYIISTVDGWSEVMSDDRSVHGYMKSEFLVIDRPRRREPLPVK